MSALSRHSYSQNREAWYPPLAGTTQLKRIFNVVPLLRDVAYFLRGLKLDALIFQHVVQILPTP